MAYSLPNRARDIQRSSRDTPDCNNYSKQDHHVDTKRTRFDKEVDVTRGEALHNCQKRKSLDSADEVNGEPQEKRKKHSVSFENDPASSEPAEDLTEEQEIARRRALRQELRAKLLSQSGANTPAHDSSIATDSEVDADIFADSQLAQPGHAIATDGPSAADYDPDADRIEEHERHSTQLTKPDADEEDDMFATPVLVDGAKPVNDAQKLEESMMDNWADPEGYYRIVIGELLDNRYAVQTILGKGVFSAVVRATDQHTNSEVAIKVIRNNEVMRKAGLQEFTILDQLQQSDPEDKRHIIRMHRTFEHRGHLCIVFESLSLNLREILKKFGRNVGLNIKAVSSYARQLFIGLAHLRKQGIIHADLKPDNILVSESRTLLKICDLGSACTIGSDLTPYLASRFYRAPEVILGLPYDSSFDVWAAGCTLYELYTGSILFPGRSNNHMLRLMQELKGRVPVKLIKAAAFGPRYFDEEYNFLSEEVDPLTEERITRSLNVSVPKLDLKSRVKGDKGIAKFVALLEQCLEFDTAKRITPLEALRHPFFT